MEKIHVVKALSLSGSTRLELELVKTYFPSRYQMIYMEKNTIVAIESKAIQG